MLDEPVNLPEGAHVRVTLDDDARRGEGAQADICCDGSPWDDSPEGRRKWLEWFDSLGPVFSDEEYEQLQSRLRVMRDEQKPLDAQRALRIESLFK